MILLYHAHASTCSQRVRQALHEKRLAYESRVLEFGRGDHIAPGYLAINPNGTVPALVHDDRPVPDSSVILEYLEDAFPDAPPLRPQEAWQASRMRAWVQFIDEVQTPAIRYPSFQRVFRHGFRNMPRADYEAMAARRPLRKHFFLAQGPEGFSQNQLDAAMEQIVQSLDRMEAALDEGPWLLGEAFGIVDISCLPSIVRLEDIGLFRLVTARAGLLDWYRRCQARPSFAHAYYPQSRVALPKD